VPEACYLKLQYKNERHVMNNIEIDPVLNVEDIKQITGYSIPSIYRLKAESMEAVAKWEEPILPLPINTGGRKRRLLWTRSSILAFLNNRDSRTPQPPTLSVSEEESASQRQRRHDAACASLKKHGVKLNDSEK
jgi:predicted DNA-binding transcriptional regulator AlpA